MPFPPSTRIYAPLNEANAALCNEYIMHSCVKGHKTVKYLDPLLSTLLKHVWQRLQPRVFLGMTLQVWYTCIWGVSFILLCAVRLDGERRCTAIFRALQRCLIGFKSGLWLGHSRTFRSLSRSHSCVVLAGMVPGFLQTWRLAFRPKSSILVSSDQRMLFLMVWESFRCLLANSKRAVTCILLSGFRLATLP